MTANKVAVVMGSDSDSETAMKAADILAHFGIPYTVSVMSAHRSPEKVWEFATSARAGGVAVIIAIAGGAAHLAGVISSATTLPVIGVPVATDVAGGLDSLLSTAQMPAGVPVLTVGTNSGGATNAAVSAARILALSDPTLAATLEDYRKSLADSVEEKDAKIKAQFKRR
jgi:5-(carboxyamino)imidazole ribonucleotide mutase